MDAASNRYLISSHTFSCLRKQYVGMKFYPKFECGNNPTGLLNSTFPIFRSFMKTGNQVFGKGREGGRGLSILDFYIKNDCKERSKKRRVLCCL